MRKYFYFFVFFNLLFNLSYSQNSDLWSIVKKQKLIYKNSGERAIRVCKEDLDSVQKMHYLDDFFVCINYSRTKDYLFNPPVLKSNTDSISIFSYRDSLLFRYKNKYEKINLIVQILELRDSSFAKKFSEKVGECLNVATDVKIVFYTSNFTIVFTPIIIDRKPIALRNKILDEFGKQIVHIYKGDFDLAFIDIPLQRPYNR